jgi:hypothetical protein
MYCKLPYVFRGVLPLKTLVLYIYRPSGTVQYNQQLYAIYSSYMVSNYVLILKGFRCLRPRRPRRDRCRLHRGPRPWLGS